MQLLSLYKSRKNQSLNLINTKQTQILIFPVGVNGNLEADSAMWLLLETSLGPTSCLSHVHPLACRRFDVSGAERCAALTCVQDRRRRLVGQRQQGRTAGYRAFASCASTLPFLRFLSDARFVYRASLTCPTSRFPCTASGTAASISEGPPQ